MYSSNTHKTSYFPPWINANTGTFWYLSALICFFNTQKIHQMRKSINYINKNTQKGTKLSLKNTT